MDEALVAKIRVRPWGGVRPNHRGFPRRVTCCAWDVETVNGRPFAWGFCAEGGPVEVAACTSRGLLAAFVTRVQRELGRRGHPLVVVWAHNLRFDLGVMLWPHLQPWDPLTARSGTVRVGDAALDYCVGRVVFARLRWRRTVALLLDTFRFFTMSLDRAAAALGFDVKKLPPPAGLGRRRIPLSTLRPYLTRDVELTFGLGRAILAWHQERDLYPSVSVAQLAMRTFLHQYVKQPWQPIPRNVWRAALLAYHAGRNGLYCAPGWHRVRLYDLNSAYPAAMRRLPSFAAGRWVRVVRPAGVWGFYRLYQGDVRQGRYPILFDHSFRPLPDGPIQRPVWVTGHELHAAIRAGAVRGVACVGYLWRPASTDLPLRRFVTDYYRRRRQATAPEHRAFLKLVLNSLYGKFIARTDRLTRDADGRVETEAVAGVQFYPVAAAWITALTRVALWRMERRVQALHSATDGVMAPPDASVPTSTRLGGWKAEGEGMALILRNKLYFVWNDQGDLLKCALHGFQGTPAQLLAMIRAGATGYHADRLREWLASAGAGRRPYENVRHAFALRCETGGYWPPPLPSLTLPIGDGWRRVVWTDLPACVSHAVPLD